MITELFYSHIINMNPFLQDVSDVHASLFLDTDELKMALRARKVSGAFEKRASGISGGLGLSLLCIGFNLPFSFKT